MMGSGVRVPSPAPLSRSGKVGDLQKNQVCKGNAVSLGPMLSALVRCCIPKVGVLVGVPRMKRGKVYLPNPLSDAQLGGLKPDAKPLRAALLEGFQRLVRQNDEPCRLGRSLITASYAARSSVSRHAWKLTSASAAGIFPMGSSKRRSLNQTPIPRTRILRLRSCAKSRVDGCIRLRIAHWSFGPLRGRAIHRNGPRKEHETGVS